MQKYHYVYRITNTKEHKHYYGSRSSTIEPKLDLGIKYFSSSSDKEFKNEQKENKSIFKYKVIKIFETRKEALNLEIKLHSKFNVGVNESFYNKAKQTANNFSTENKVICYDINNPNEPFSISKEQFKDNGNLVGISKNMIVCRNKVTGEISRVTVEEFYSNETLVGISTGFQYDNTGKVTCKVLGSDKFLKVTKEEFDSRDDLVGATRGTNLEFSDEHKQKISDALKGICKTEKHKLNLSLSQKNKVSCKDINTGKIFKVSKEEFDSRDDLVGSTKDIREYIILTPSNEKIHLIGKSNFRTYCVYNNISISAMLKSNKYNLAVCDSKLFYNKTLNTKIRNAFGYQLISID